ncbi:hypothetical protein [Brevundimonas sp. GCM10030266]|uniref:hypothetical protein n=1 Tax=Brevundimonas sp. GCM10030266 TaxID=3273386 RepID=UPI00361D5D80
MSLTFERLDAIGPAGYGELFGKVAKGKAGSALARAQLLEHFTDGAISVADVQADPTAYPVVQTTKALWQAWEIAQYGPAGRPAVDGAANPPSRRPTLLARLFTKR